MIDPVKARHCLMRATRHFFDARDYLEVDTPILVTCPGVEVHLDYFSSEWIDHGNQPHKLFLRSSPELHMKQLLVRNYERIYQIAKSFRNNGELSQWHNPEFAMLEWYEQAATYKSFMDLTHTFLQETSREFNKAMNISHFVIADKPVMLTVAEAFNQFAKLDLIDNDSELAARGRALGYHSLNAKDDFETAYFKIWLDVIEPELARLNYVVVYDFLPSQAALAKVENGYAKRFEFYVAGVELSNAFLELVDADANRTRCDQINIKRQQNNKQHTPTDPFFLEALKSGLAPCSGNALGFDRWLTILTGETSIHSVIPFSDQIYS